MTMSCVEDAKAVSRASAPKVQRPPAGCQSAMPTSPAMTSNCETAIQPRRRPSQRPISGASSLSMAGAQTNLNE